MAHTPRPFGQRAELSPIMKSGEDFFVAVESIDIDTLLTRARRINKIAATATKLTAKKLQREGENQADGFVYSAYRNIHDITARVIPEVGTEQAEELLTSEQTHSTLLLASSAMKGYQLDKLTKNYRIHGAGFYLDDTGLAIQDGFTLPKPKQIWPWAKKRPKKVGCPYAYGNAERAAFFTDATDNIVRTYVEAYRRDMPL